MSHQESVCSPCLVADSPGILAGHRSDKWRAQSSSRPEVPHLKQCVNRPDPVHQPAHSWYVTTIQRHTPLGGRASSAGLAAVVFERPSYLDRGLSKFTPTRPAEAFRRCSMNVRVMDLVYQHLGKFIRAHGDIEDA